MSESRDSATRIGAKHYFFSYLTKTPLYLDTKHCDCEIRIAPLEVFEGVEVVLVRGCPRSIKLTLSFCKNDLEATWSRDPLNNAKHPRNYGYG